MRKMLNFAAAAALLLAPTSVLAISQNKQDKINKLEAKADAIQAKRDAVEAKAGGSPNAKQQAKLDKLAMREDKVQNQEQTVKDRADKSN